MYRRRKSMLGQERSRSHSSLGGGRRGLQRPAQSYEQASALKTAQAMSTVSSPPLASSIVLQRINQKEPATLQPVNQEPTTLQPVKQPAALQPVKQPAALPPISKEPAALLPINSQAAAKWIQRRWRGRGRDSIVAIDDLTTKAVSLIFDPESPVIAAGAPEAPAVDQGRGVVGNLFQRYAR